MGKAAIASQAGDERPGRDGPRPGERPVNPRLGQHYQGAPGPGGRAAPGQPGAPPAWTGANSGAMARLGGSSGLANSGALPRADENSGPNRWPGATSGPIARAGVPPGQSPARACPPGGELRGTAARRRELRPQPVARRHLRADRPRGRALRAATTGGRTSGPSRRGPRPGATSGPLGTPDRNSGPRRAGASPAADRPLGALAQPPLSQPSFSPAPCARGRAVPPERPASPAAYAEPRGTGFRDSAFTRSRPNTVLDMPGRTAVQTRGPRQPGVHRYAPTEAMPTNGATGRGPRRATGVPTMRPDWRGLDASGRSSGGYDIPARGSGGSSTAGYSTGTYGTGVTAPGATPPAATTVRWRRRAGQRHGPRRRQLQRRDPAATATTGPPTTAPLPPQRRRPRGSPSFPRRPRARLVAPARSGALSRLAAPTPARASDCPRVSGPLSSGPRHASPAGSARDDDPLTSPLFSREAMAAADARSYQGSRRSGRDTGETTQVFTMNDRQPAAHRQRAPTRTRSPPGTRPSPAIRPLPRGSGSRRRDPAGVQPQAMQPPQQCRPNRAATQARPRCRPLAAAPSRARAILPAAGSRRTLPAPHRVTRAGRRCRRPTPIRTRCLARAPARATATPVS